jgi:hypothetical protein
MEYLARRGSFDDVPLAQMTADFARLYPQWNIGREDLGARDFMADAARETGR